MHAHAALIDRIGLTPVANHCDVKLTTACNWRQRGVSWANRPTFATLAAAKGVSLPPDFLQRERKEEKKAPSKPAAKRRRAA